MMKILCLICGLLAVVSCKSNGSQTAVPAETAPSVAAPVTADADSLYAFVEAQTSLGPRTPGSDAHGVLRSFIAERLRLSGADTVTVQKAPVTLFDGSKQTAYNILGRYNPSATQRILLLAHYDTRPWADRDPDESNRTKPISGANDGASGVASLLEIARLLGTQRPDSLGVDLLFVDVEDSGTPDDGQTEDSENSWALGVQEWVKDMPYSFSDMPRFAILLDMVGGRDARFHREYFSQRDARAVVDRVWSIARESGLGDRFVNEIGGAIIDDHLHLNTAGIPCIDIIESMNPETHSFNPTWHTMADNIDNIDRNTLRDVTQVVLNVIFATK